MHPQAGLVVNVGLSAGPGLVILGASGWNGAISAQSHSDSGLSIEGMGVCGARFGLWRLVDYQACQPAFAVLRARRQEAGNHVQTARPISDLVSMVAPEVSMV